MPRKINFAVTFDCPAENGPRYSFYINPTRIITGERHSDLVVKVLDLLEEEDFHISGIKISNGFPKYAGTNPLSDEEFKPFRQIQDLHNQGVQYRKG